MALPRRLDDRQRRAILRSRLVEYDWERTKRARSSSKARRQRIRALEGDHAGS